MNNPAQATSTPNTHGAADAPLERAFAALAKYDTGSPRASLLPIDAAVAAAVNNPASRGELEHRFGTLLEAGASTVAREYICAKLTVVGSDASVPRLKPLLNDPHLATGARNALEAIPGLAAARALIQNLAAAAPNEKVGAINSLGARREETAVRPLARLLRDADAEVAAAAAAALGEIGSRRCARALRACYAEASDTVKQRISDAMLTCAEHLADAGEKTGARSLYETLSGAPQPKHVQLAIARGLAKS